MFFFDITLLIHTPPIRRASLPLILRRCRRRRLLFHGYAMRAAAACSPAGIRDIDACFMLLLSCR